MPNYRRLYIAGGTYFFTVVTSARKPILCQPANLSVLTASLEHVGRRRPFKVVAHVILPDHLHMIWTLPEGDSDFSVRWRLIKTRVSRALRGRIEGAIWQDRFWEHAIRDEDDLNRHIDYIHFNPPKHGLVENAIDWPHSSIHRFIAEGLYPAGYRPLHEVELEDPE